jgi:hypothetical protein
MVAGGLVATVTAPPAHAAVTDVTEFPFVGNVSECGTLLCLGDRKSFSGSFEVDPTVGDLDPSSDIGFYGTGGAPAGTMNLTFHGTSYAGGVNYDVYDDSPVLGADVGREKADGFFINGVLGDVDANQLRFVATLVGEDLDLFNSDDLPTEVSDLAEASLAFAGVTIETFAEQNGKLVVDQVFEGEMNVVPLPGAVVFLASGLAGLAALRRRAQA